MSEEMNEFKAELIDMMLDTMPKDVARGMVVALANVVVGLRNGELSKDDIPDTVTELLMVTFRPVTKVTLIKRKAAAAGKETVQ